MEPNKPYVNFKHYIFRGICCSIEGIIAVLYAVYMCIVSCTVFYIWLCRKQHIPDSKVHGVNMGPSGARQDPGGSHVGPMTFVIWDVIKRQLHKAYYTCMYQGTLYLQSDLMNRWLGKADTCASTFNLFIQYILFRVVCTYLFKLHFHACKHVIDTFVHRFGCAYLKY